MTPAVEAERAKLRRSDPSLVWHGAYRGISFKVVQWSFGVPSQHLPEKCWNHYIFLAIDSIPDEFKPESFWLRSKPSKWPKKIGDKEVPSSIRERKLHYYSDHPIIPEIEFHGGVTFYEKHVADDDSRYIEIGCDYQHSWDEGQAYELNYILRQVEQSIDSVYQLMPEYGRKEEQDG